MNPVAYYNEIEPYAAQWLRNLIAAGHIAPGVVDTRSIEDVCPSDLTEFTQCHFFAGIGVWSLALRRAGWPDARRVWTGSCPCQPFSTAGKGGGFADERHLWPHFHYLIEECRPPVVLGEQVASADGLAWFDLVQADLEATSYASGAADLCAAGVGAPHIRQRLYWVAHADHQRRVGQRVLLRAEEGGRDSGGVLEATRRGCVDGLAHAAGEGLEGCRPGRGSRSGSEGAATQRGGEAGGLADSEGEGQPHRGAGRTQPEFAALDRSDCATRPGPTNGRWSAADWLQCRDGKWRPVSPQPQPLVDGSAEILGRVRPEVITQVEEEVNAATAQTEGGRAAAMRALLKDLGAQAQRSWSAGRLPGLHEAPFLLAFLRQLQEQGWHLAEGVALSRAEATSGVLRSVWHEQATAGASHRRGLDEQRADEPADVVRVLSCLLARHASAAWDDAYAAYAETGSPLAHGARSRVGRLRAYGNAINADQAEVFIRAVMECMP